MSEARPPVVTLSWGEYESLRRALDEATTRAVRCEGVVDAIRQHCRVIYYPLDERFRYIEHSLDANKDMWDVLLAKLEVHR